MSKVQIEILDDRWFRGEWDFRPQDNQLCVAIPKDKELDVEIYQYRNGVFLNICALQMMGITDCMIYVDDIDRWKPLGLPEDVEEWVLAEVEKWFEEDE